MQAPTKPTVVPGGTQFPMIKAVSTSTSTIIAEITFAEILNQRQIDALRDMYASYKKKRNLEWMIALGVSGRIATFRVFTNKPIPPEKEVQKMLEALGLNEVNYVPPAPKKSVISPAAKKSSRPRSGSSARITP